MDSRKLERILILILLCLNLCLLAVVLSDSIEARRARAETAATLGELLEENGITAADDAISILSAPPKCTLTRDMQAEQRIVKALVGRAQVEDQGGNIFFYSGAKGQAQLRGSGELDVIFSPGAVTRRGSMERFVQRLLRRSDIRAVSAADSGDAADFYATLDGIPVYNAVLHFEFQGKDLYIMSGTRLFDTVVREEDAALLDSVSVLIRFVELVREEGFICTRIDAVAPGYLQTVIRSGEAALAPVWSIRTDAGTFVIDAETGKAVNRLS